MELILYFRTLLPPSKLRHGLSKLFRLFGSFFLGIGGKRKLPREKCWSFFEKEFFVGFRASLLFYFVLSAIEWPVPAYNDVEQANIYPLFQHKVHKKSVTSNRNAAFYFQIRCKQSPEQHLWTPMVSILLSIIVCTFKQKSIIKSENSKQIFYDYKQRKI